MPHSGIASLQRLAVHDPEIVIDLHRRVRLVQCIEMNATDLVIEQVTALFRGPRGSDEEWFPTPVSRLTRRTKSCVREPVNLPAPYVTDTNEDFRVSSRWIDTYSLSAASAVREGKLSKGKNSRIRVENILDVHRPTPLGAENAPIHSPPAMACRRGRRPVSQIFS